MRGSRLDRGGREGHSRQRDRQGQRPVVEGSLTHTGKWRKPERAEDGPRGHTVRSEAAARPGEALGPVKGCIFPHEI